VCASQLGIKSRFNQSLTPIAGALEGHWREIYDHASGAVTSDYTQWSNRRIQLNTEAIKVALTGHVSGKDQALVLAGGYEVPLSPLLREFASVEVSDLAAAPLKQAIKTTEADPNRNRLALIQMDLSGIRAEHQMTAARLLGRAAANGKLTDPSIAN